jgi:hypothetical protein
MNPIPITIGGETTLVPRLRIQQIIDLSTRRFERDRLDLVADLNDAGVDAEQRLDQLREHRKECGLSSVIVRSAFSVEGAIAIVTDAMGGELPQQFASISPDEMSRLALGCIGVELEEKAERSAEGKAQA